MPHRSLIVLPATLAVIVSAAPDPGPPTFDLSWNTMDAGGGTTTSTSGAFELSGTIGQPDASAPGAMIGSGGLTLTGGFWIAAAPAAPPCPADCASPGDGLVSVTDLLALLAQWSGPGTCDVSGDGVVNVTDLLALLAAWGTCP
jgi:hypothetical protein